MVLCESVEISIGGLSAVKNSVSLFVEIQGCGQNYYNF